MMKLRKHHSKKTTPPTTPTHKIPHPQNKHPSPKKKQKGTSKSGQQHPKRVDGKSAGVIVSDPQDQTLRCADRVSVPFSTK